MESKNFLAQSFFLLGSFTFLLVLLYIGKSFLLPFIAAVVVWYLIISLIKLLSLEFRGYCLPKPAPLLLSIVICVLCIGIISSIVGENLERINDKVPEYQTKFIALTESGLDKYLPNSSVDATTFLQQNVFGAIDFRGVISELAKAAGGIAGKTILIIIYVIFLLMEYKKFPQKIRRITEKGKSYGQTVGILNDISQDLNNYFKIKAVASLATGLLSYIVLVAFGVDFAAFWALLIFLLNFIPTVGSIIATSFPVFVAFVQFGGGYEFFVIGLVLVSIQILIGSILEPRFQGSTLNISPLIIILSLAFWSMLWGVLGALLCIPIMATINIILSKFPSTQWISLLISADGRGKGYKNIKWHKKIKKHVKKLRQ